MLSTRKMWWMMPSESIVSAAKTRNYNFRWMPSWRCIRERTISQRKKKLLHADWGLGIGDLADRWSITIILFIRYFWHFTRTAQRLYGSAGGRCDDDFSILPSITTVFVSRFAPIDDLYRLITLPRKIASGFQYQLIAINCQIKWLNWLTERRMWSNHDDSRLNRN